MSKLRELAHLQKQSGEDRSNGMKSSNNRGMVSDPCDQLLMDAMPTSMTVGDRTYNMLGLLRGDETSVVWHTMVERVKEMNAHLGNDDGQYLLDNQQDIPVALCGKVVFVFTDWHHPDYPMSVGCVFWCDDRWVRDWGWSDRNFDGRDRVLRRK